MGKSDPHKHMERASSAPGVGPANQSNMRVVSCPEQQVATWPLRTCAEGPPDNS
jgi:hypothetical protein